MRPLYTIENGVPGVRYVTPTDEGQLFHLLSLMHQEMAFFSMNAAKVRDGIRVGTRRQGGLIFVIDEDNVVVASLGMILACDWYSDDWYWLERWNYVHPEHRQGNNYARRLIE